jgi:hypothetical protein
MAGKVIEFRGYQEAKAISDEKSEYRLLEEIMRTLFGPLMEQAQPALQPVKVQPGPTRRR